MNNSKNLLLIALMFLSVLLYTEWQKDYTVKEEVPQQAAVSTNNINDTIPQDTQQATTQNLETPEQDVPKMSNDLISNTATTIENKSNIHVVSTVETPLLKLQFSEKGAALVYAELKQYPVSKGSTENIVLFDHLKNNYVAESGLIGSDIDLSHKLVFTTDKSEIEFDSGSIELVFRTKTELGELSKIYEINAETYDMTISMNLFNESNENLNLAQYHQLKRDDPWVGTSGSLTDTSRYSFVGAGYFDDTEGYEKKDFDDIQEEKTKVTLKENPWASMVQHYFISAIIPAENNVSFQTEYFPNSVTPYLIRYITPAYQVAAGSQHQFKSKIYVGPKLQKNLPAVAKGLDLTVDYGIFTAISKPLFWVLEKIHSVVGNWGWAIILLTVLIKLLFFKLTEAQYKSMARMRKLQPRIATLKERYKENKQKFNEEMMKLYKNEKVNPLGGCLPLLVQIPVFIALYWVLLESVELRQAPFMLWLTDLSSPDPYFILPAINAAAMIMTQRLSPTPGMDPLQQKIMKFMPVAFSVLFAFFQSGLVLYWAVNSVLSLAQQWVITKKIEAQE